MTMNMSMIMSMTTITSMITPEPSASGSVGSGSVGSGSVGSGSLVHPRFPG
jgi:hypothetical protein